MACTWSGPSWGGEATHTALTAEHSQVGTSVARALGALERGDVEMMGGVGPCPGNLSLGGRNESGEAGRAQRRLRQHGLGLRRIRELGELRRALHVEVMHGVGARPGDTGIAGVEELWRRGAGLRQAAAQHAREVYRIGRLS